MPTSRDLWADTVTTAAIAQIYTPPDATATLLCRASVFDNAVLHAQLLCALKVSFQARACSQKDIRIHHEPNEALLKDLVPAAKQARQQ
jgi:hypothetical protein